MINIRITCWNEYTSVEQLYLKDRLRTIITEWANFRNAKITKLKIKDGYLTIKFANSSIDTLFLLSINLKNSIYKLVT